MPDDFGTLAALAEHQSVGVILRPVVEKELVHYDILYCLDRAGLLDPLVFQGGTSLRLCYGSKRLREALDCVVGKDFDIEALAAMKSCIEAHLTDRYGLEVQVQEPEQQDEEERSIHVITWQISVMTAPG